MTEYQDENGNPLSGDQIEIGALVNGIQQAVPALDIASLPESVKDEIRSFPSSYWKLHPDEAIMEIENPGIRVQIMSAHGFDVGCKMLARHENQPAAPNMKLTHLFHCAMS